MKPQIRKFLALVLCLTMLLNLGMISFAQDKSPMGNMDNIELIYNNNDFAKVIVESNNGLVTAIINKKTQAIDLTTYEYKTNERKVYDAEVLSMSEDTLDAVLTEKNMSLSKVKSASYGMSRMINLDRSIETKSPTKLKLSSKNNDIKVTKLDDERRFAWLLLLAPEVLAALAAVGATCLTFIAVGVTWHTRAAIQDLVKEQKRSVKYFAAMLKNGVIMAGGTLTFDQAKAAVKSGADVFARDKWAAEALVEVCGGPARAAEYHGGPGDYGDYYYHYHPKDKPKVHIFYIGLQ